IMQIALGSEPEASTTAPIRPSTMSEKYSAGPNLKATSARGGAKPAIMMVATQPAKNDPRAAMASAAPARPLRAIWWPSSTVTTARRLMVVEECVVGGGVAGQRHQKCGSGTPVSSTVINTGQHNEPRHGRQHVGDGQQHGDSRHGADARQHADQSAEQTAQQT